MKINVRLTIGLLAFACANLVEPLFVRSASAQVSEAGTQLKVEIEINNTPTPADDYLTWAPTPARIRLAAPNANAVTVALTNDPEQPTPADRDQPVDGDVAFAEKLSKGETAALKTLTLTLPADGSWVSFFVAGSFPRASTADKDAVIEAHLGEAAGPMVGSQATMVRVRKNVDRLTVGERNAFLKALHDLHVEAKAFESFPQMHDLASKGKIPYQQIFLSDGTTLNPKYWPDQAHQGSAFLPWHRAFLLLLERRLQSINPAVTIPYWRLNAPTKAFDRMFLGTNRRAVDTFQTEVIFSPANWLYGWSISYSDLKTVVRAPKDTSLLHLSSGATLIGDTQLFGATPLNPAYASFHGDLETNPHNYGHGLLGAWHANCLISPADPSFWPFHAEHDRLWAKWQWFHGRFDAEGISTDSYEFPGVFVADDTATTTLGHNLKDTMWPWDGSKGRIVDDKNSRANRPDENPFPAFPMASVAGLWPTSDAKPKPADMIDYLGLSSTRLPHGVAYDDVPYGVRSQPVSSSTPESAVSIASVLADTARDNRAPENRRMASLSMLRAAGHSRPDAVFQAVASDLKAPTQVRRQASMNLIESSPAGGMGAVLALVDRGGEAADALTTSVIDTAPLVHHGKLPADVHARMHHLLTMVATNTRDPRAVPAAIVLAEMLDANAPKYLTALLKSANVRGATRAQVVAALPLASPGAAPTLRDVLEKALRENDTETALAALRALAGDQDSRALRLKLIDADDNVDPLINRAAMRSLMHETAGVAPRLLQYIEGTLPPTESRKLESAGAFRVTIESLKPFPRSQVDDWKNRIRTVRDGAPNSATEFKDALSMVLDVLERAAS